VLSAVISFVFLELYATKHKKIALNILEIKKMVLFLQECKEKKKSRIRMKQNKSFPFHFDAIEENTGFLFWQVSHTWQVMQGKLLKQHFGISHVQYVILASAYWLHLHDIEATQTDLVNHTKIEKMTISKNLEVLQKKGYVTKSSDISDSRYSVISLSEKGKKLLLAAIERIEAFDTDFFKPIGQELANMNQTLINLIDGNNLSYKA
jgi:DNA-binding MarR family transcriptional regulator